jgi:hypothetical protein
MHLPSIAPPVFIAALALGALSSACSGEPSAGQGGSGPTSTSAQAMGEGGASGVGGSGGAPPMVKPPPFAWVGILGTGQSLSVGYAGTPVVSTTQPFGNLKLLDSGSDPKYDGVGDVLSLVPLIAPIRPKAAMTGAYPNDIFGETIHEGMANQISATAEALGKLTYTTVHSVVGESGRGIAYLKKGGVGHAYAASVYEVSAIAALAKAAGKTYGIGAVVLTHGETDALDETYEAQIAKLAADYAADLPALTGQTEPIPMFVTQQGTLPLTAKDRPASAVAAWKLGLDNPGKIFCVGPKYQYGYAPDHVHLDALNYRRLGEKYGEIYARVVMLGEAWRPLQPRKLDKNGTTVTIDFDVPDPPLAWEESMPAPHQSGNLAWSKGRGFEVVDATGPLTITGAEIVGTSVRLSLAAPPGPGLVVRYAMTQDVDGATGGTPSGRRGQLRDADPFVGRDAATIACETTAGATTVTSAPGTFAERIPGDVVTGPGVPADTVVIGKSGDAALELSRPVDKGGAAMLSFHHDLRNYAVHFELAE